MSVRFAIFDIAQRSEIVLCVDVSLSENKFAYAYTSRLVIPSVTTHEYAVLLRFLFAVKDFNTFRTEPLTATAMPSYSASNTGL